MIGKFWDEVCSKSYRETVGSEVRYVVTRRTIPVQMIPMNEFGHDK